MAADKTRRLRSREWFDNPHDPDMTALYLERYMNFGLTLEELQGGKPIIGIAQTGSDLSPCNRHHQDLVWRIRDGIRDAGGVPIVFPVHPIQETGKRPTASLDRNLAYLSLVEVLFGYAIDGVVLTTGCDKTTPAMLMGAATVDIPAIVLSGVLAGKLATMIEAVEREFGSAAECFVPKGGIFLWIRLPEAVDVRRLVKPAAAAGIQFNPGPEWACDPESAKSQLRLCFALPSEAEIRDGVAAFARVCFEETGIPRQSGNVPHAG